MKQQILIFFFFSVLFCGCSKEYNSSLPLTGHSFTDSAIDYLNSHLSSEELSALSPHQHVVLTYQNENRFLLIYYKNKDQFILLQKTAGGFASNRITLNLSDQERNTGVMLTEDLITHEGHLISFVNGVVKKVDPTIEGRINSYAVSHSTINPKLSIFPAKTQDVEVIYIFIGGGGGGSSYGVNLASLYYTTNFDGQFYYSYVQAPTGAGGSGNYGGGGNSGTTTTSSVVDLPMIPAAEKPIDINKELECFGIVNGATYTLRINVNQPNPLTRDITNSTAKRTVGHTFITLEQKNPDGTIISRNVGWYPEDFIKPGDGLKPGVYQDDTKTPYAVAMTVSVTPTEFMNSKNYLVGVKQYGLQDANCTTVGIAAFARAGINLPKTVGIIESPKNNYTPLPQDRFPIFKGVNPGDLGEDIRAINATTFSRNNGGRVVTIEKSNYNAKTRGRSGTCK